MIRLIDPHSATRPVYLLDRNDGIGVFDPRAVDALAITGVFFSERFRPLLERRGDYDGPGFVAILDTARIGDWLVWQGIVLHEYVHDVQFRDFQKRLLAGDCDPSVMADFKSAADLGKPCPVATAFDQELSYHCGHFIRLAIHAAARAEQCGWLGDTWYVINPEQYHLSDVREYERALGDEPQRLADLPLSEVDKLPPPAAYQDFAAADVENAKRRYTEWLAQSVSPQCEDEIANMDETLASLSEASTHLAANSPESHNGDRSCQAVVSEVSRSRDSRDNSRMIEDWLQPQVPYRLCDLAEWLSLPTEPIRIAALAGEVRSLGEGPFYLTVMGMDMIDFVREHDLPFEVTPEGRRALGDIDKSPPGGFHRHQKDGTSGKRQSTPPAPDHNSTPLGDRVMAAQKSTRSAARSHHPAAPVELIPIERIIPGPNPREAFDEERLRSLADSILQVGLIEPIVVRLQGEDYEIVCGERRYRACQLLERDSIEATVRDLADKQAAELRLLENLDREDLNPLEEASALRQLRELGHDVASLANIVRRTEDEVAQREALLTLPEFWQDRIRTGKLSAPAGQYLLDWLDYPDVLSAMESHAAKWPMPLTEWKRYLHDTVMLLSRNMDPDAPDGPLFDPTAEERERLDCRTFKTSPRNTHCRAFSVTLWDRLQDQAEAEGDAETTSPVSANGQPRSLAEMAEQVGDADPDGELEAVHDAAFWNRLSDWKANWLRQLIARRLADCDLDELAGFCELLAVEPEDQWTLSRGFLQLHDSRQLDALSEELSVDISDAENADEVKAILLHVQPEAMPETVRTLEERSTADTVSH